MTSRERIEGVLSGRPVDRKPTVSWPGVGESDIQVLPLDRVEPSTGQLVLCEIANPFGRGLVAGVNLADELGRDLASGESELSRYAEATRTEMDLAISRGADGILYRLNGARADLSTPMAYGGHFLEVDRALLDGCAPGAFRLVFAVGGEDSFLDFLTDLPCEAFGWDVRETGVSVKQLRAMREGLLAAADPEADIEMSFGPAISRAVEIAKVAAHA